MDELENGYIPSKLDKPPTFIWWTYDVVAVTLVPFYFLVIMMKMPVIGMVTAIALGWAFNRFKSQSHPQFLKHAWYWFMTGILKRKTKSLPESYIRKFIG